LVSKIDLPAAGQNQAPLFPIGIPPDREKRPVVLALDGSERPQEFSGADEIVVGDKDAIGVFVEKPVRSRARLPHLAADGLVFLMLGEPHKRNDDENENERGEGREIAFSE
jgi:hypothetical protein